MFEEIIIILYPLLSFIVVFSIGGRYANKMHDMNKYKSYLENPKMNKSAVQKRIDKLKPRISKNIRIGYLFVFCSAIAHFLVVLSYWYRNDGFNKFGLNGFYFSFISSCIIILFLSIIYWLRGARTVDHRRGITGGGIGRGI